MSSSQLIKARMRDAERVLSLMSWNAFAGHVESIRMFASCTCSALVPAERSGPRATMISTHVSMRT